VIQRLGVVLLMVCITSAPAHADDWTGADKGAHFGYSAAFGAGATTTVPLVGGPGPDWRSFAIGAGIGVVPGIAKEVWDLSGRGDASWKDLAWDAIGAVVGAGIVWAVQAITTPSHAH
jgi:putative lipoprotein